MTSITLLIVSPADVAEALRLMGLPDGAVLELPVYWDAARAEIAAEAERRRAGGPERLLVWPPMTSGTWYACDTPK
jgi:hypothetical protein